ncbi:hypothetical protein QBC47DRAFT_386349 [Echria macrotheca]|uniref:FHA domain-containing protein n=1 Tax=Echria macrotheca TaxID=438768 RepID=A0AAJ0B844_9PEZI|nr:hypothetical protein QBC47DRAFT_386349 [Echria macrotheca]
MWLLESELFGGKKLWLRPGKLYLFGRTAAEPGQLAISDKTISRKHLTIQVDKVPEGAGQNLHARSRITIEDLESKKGTLVNDVQIRGQKIVLTGDTNEIKLGACSRVLCIRWHPVVLSFSFTSKELRADPWTTLRVSLEQLDIKYSSEYETSTSHVVSKKRNTSKGLLALINGKYIVTDSFISAIVEAATLREDAVEGEPSPLEDDFEANWPNALEHLPPRGEEPTARPAESYAPNEGRQEVFEGYTFVFYEKKQYENLFPVITSGRGKALFKEVIPKETNIDDFIRYVKGIAGEKGLGVFEDGSEGRGVVVVRYIPAKEGNVEWFAQFLTSVAQRLDHRPIDQREFLEAILACDASMLRRPLEEDKGSQPTSGAANGTETRVDLEQPPQHDIVPAARQDEPAPAPRRGRPRRPAVGRFKGFALDSDPEEESPAPEPVEDKRQDVTLAGPAARLPDSLFVSQQNDSMEMEAEEEQPRRVTRASARKRPLSPLPDRDNSAFMDGIAPSAAAAKRRRVETGQTPIPASPTPEVPADEDEEMAVESPPKKGAKTKAAKGRGKKAAGENDVLELARQRREEEQGEAMAAAEDRARADGADDIDYAAIRALHIIEECEVRVPSGKQAPNSRDQEIADGRWDPRWNGRRNFKRFKKQGEAGGRGPAKVVFGLEEVKPKEYGIGDDYWLENERSNPQNTETQPEPQSEVPEERAQAVEESVTSHKSPVTRRTVVAMDSSDEEEEVAEEEFAKPEPPRSRVGKLAQREGARRGQSQSQSQSQTTSVSTRASKRTAVAESSNERATKRLRTGLQAKDGEASDDDESDDDLKFRFGRTRG